MSDLSTSAKAMSDLTAIYRFAKGIVDNKKTGKQGDTIIRLTDNGQTHKISAEVNGDDKIRGLFKTWAKRSEPNKQANNATRDIFKDLVLSALGKEDQDIKNLSPKLKEAMNSDDFDGKGHPLSARRIVDAYEAMLKVEEKESKSKLFEIRTHVAENLYSILKDENKRNEVKTDDVKIIRSSEVHEKKACTQKKPLHTMYGSSTEILNKLQKQYPGKKFLLSIAADGTETGGGMFRGFNTQEETTLLDTNPKTVVKLYKDGACKFNDSKIMDEKGHNRLEYQPGKSPVEDPYIVDIQVERVNDIEIKDPIDAMAGFQVLPSLTWHAHSFDKKNTLFNLEKCRAQQNKPLTEQQKANADKAVDIMLAKIKEEIDYALIDDSKVGQYKLWTNDATGVIYKSIPAKDKNGNIQKDEKGNILYEKTNEKAVSKSGFNNAKVFSEALKAFSFSNADELSDIFDCSDERELSQKIDELFQKINEKNYNAKAVEENYEKELVNKFEEYYKLAKAAGVDGIVEVPKGCGAFMNDPKKVLKAMAKGYFNSGANIPIIWSQFKADAKSVEMQKLFKGFYDDEAKTRNLPKAPNEEYFVPKPQENLIGDGVYIRNENDFNLLEDDSSKINQNEIHEPPRDNFNDEVDNNDRAKNLNECYKKMSRVIKWGDLDVRGSKKEYNYDEKKEFNDGLFEACDKMKKNIQIVKEARLDEDTKTALLVAKIRELLNEIFLQDNIPVEEFKGREMMARDGKYAASIENEMNDTALKDMARDFLGAGEEDYSMGKTKFVDMMNKCYQSVLRMDSQYKPQDTTIDNISSFISAISQKL